MKSEKDKMLAGELYDASDALLVEERRNARDLLHRLNVTEYADPSSYGKIVASLLPNAAADISIEPPFFCDYGYNIYTGGNVYFNFNCVLLDVLPICIGTNVLFGPNVQIYTAAHPKDAMQRRDGLEYGEPVTIGDDCWIGGSAVIRGGVTIGSRCIIGAGSVIVKDVPDDSAVAGNPGRPVKISS